MTTMSQGNKKIIIRKIPATNNKVLVRTGSLRFFNKYRQPIEKCWSVPVQVRETVRIIKPWPCWRDYLLLASPGIYPQVYQRTRKKQRRDRIISNFTKRESFSCLYIKKVIILQLLPLRFIIAPFKKRPFFPFQFGQSRREYIWKLNWKESLLIYFENWQLLIPTGRLGIGWLTLL